MSGVSVPYQVVLHGIFSLLIPKPKVANPGKRWRGVTKKNMRSARLSLITIIFDGAMAALSFVHSLIN